MVEKLHNYACTTNNTGGSKANYNSKSLVKCMTHFLKKCDFRTIPIVHACQHGGSSSKTVTSKAKNYFLGFGRKSRILDGKV
jgi:hypothetical protein